VAIPITVPRRDWSMDEGTFTAWLKEDGDRIERGDAVFVLESTKAAEEIESLDAGILRIPPNGPKPGDIVKVGQVVAYLVAEGEAVPEASAEQPAIATVVAETASPVTVAPAVPARHKQAVSPRARRVAAELGVDYHALQGSGRNGRIRERDVRAALASKGTGRLLAHTNVRRTIAARMVAGVTQAAPVTLTTTADATNLVSLTRLCRPIRTWL
jgi:pyruvate dehydrogenase E2 component (dihydrolipoamide acetyltransferase)